MNTKEQKIKNKVITLMDDMRPEMEKKLEKLLNDPRFAPVENTGNWANPKLIMNALCREMARLFEPPASNKVLKKKADEFYAIL